MLVVQPVYLRSHGGRSPARDDRTPAPPVLQGFAVAVFQVPELVETVYDAAYRDHSSLRIFDRGAERRLLYGTPSVWRERGSAALKWSARRSRWPVASGSCASPPRAAISRPTAPGGPGPHRRRHPC